MADGAADTSELELAAFRERWRREVEEKRRLGRLDAQASNAAASASGTTSGSRSAAPTELPPPHPSAEAGDEGEPPAARLGLLQRHGRSGSSSSASERRNASKSKNKPEPSVAVYAKAIAAERAGLLNDALVSYRKAFRLDPDVDKHYHKLSKEQVEGLEKGGSKDEEGDGDDEFAFQRTVQLEQDYEAAHAEGADHPSSTHRLLTLLETSFRKNPFFVPSSIPSEARREPPDALHPQEFHPADAEIPCYFRRLPPELVLSILCSLLPGSTHGTAVLVEAFGKVCRRARVLTLDSALWRRVTERCFASESQGLARRRGGLEGYCRQQHGADWRRMYIEQPRVRTDGVYIAIVTYLRRGESANSWYAPSHFVTYFRYLRFFPSGSVFSLLTTDPPASTVHRLDGALRATGLTHGRWRLEGDRVRCVDLDDPPPLTDDADGALLPVGRQRARARDEASRGGGKYTFRMECRLRNTQRGKMNKLDLLSLGTVHKQTKEFVSLSLRNQTPFFFSRVVSYES